MGKEKTLDQLVKERSTGVYAFCDECVTQTLVVELETYDDEVQGICDDCLNTVTVSKADLLHEGKSF